MRALTIKQPWASLITSGIKDVENRSWSTKHRGTLYIHAGAAYDKTAPHAWKAAADPWGCGLPKSGFVAIVDLVDCVHNYDSPFANHDEFQWVLANARTVPFVPCKGKLGLWTPDETTQAALSAAARSASIAGPTY